MRKNIFFGIIWLSLFLTSSGTVRCPDFFLSYRIRQNGFIHPLNRWIFKQIITHIMTHTDYDICSKGNKDSVLVIENSDGVVRGVTSLRRWNCSWNLSNGQKEESFRLEETVCAEEAGKSMECLRKKMLAWLVRNEPNRVLRWGYMYVRARTGSVNTAG